MSPELVFRYLTERGARIEGEYLIIAEWLVQFLPPTGPLVEEALEAAVEVEVEEISTRVFTQILKSKQAYRAQLAARPIVEKLRMLEELRKRALAIAASRRK